MARISRQNTRLCFASAGILTGANMSGDLRDPQKSIPAGTILAQLTCSFIFLLLVFVYGGTTQADVLRDKYCCRYHCNNYGAVCVCVCYGKTQKRQSARPRPIYLKFPGNVWAALATCFRVEKRSFKDYATSASARRISAIPQAVKFFQHPTSLSRPTFPSFIVCLCLA